MKIPFVDLKPMHNEIKNDLNKAFKRVVFDESNFIYGRECVSFEKEFAKYTNAKYCVGVASGLDALCLALRALDVKKGDEVIIPSNTFIATALAVSYVGATPIFVEPTIETYNIDISKIEDKITKRTKCIIPVHLQGRPADLEPILKISKKYHLHVIDDAAQAHGAKYKGKRIGSLTEITCWSFYPGKNLGALGDAGCITTNNKKIANRIRLLGNYGSDYKYHHIEKGVNSRLDELQAAILRIKLKNLDKWNKERIKIAKKYIKEINNPLITLPLLPDKKFDHIYHIFAIRCKKRDELEKYLNNHGVITNKHYPLPIYLQKAYDDLFAKKGSFTVSEEISNTELSIPIYYGLKESDQSTIIKLLNNFH